jgi:hypothetical protein
MNKLTEEILEKNGWSLDCSSPLEISHPDGSFASNQAAKMIIAKLVLDAKTMKDTFEESMSDLIVNYEGDTDSIFGCVYFNAKDKETCFVFDGEKFVAGKYSDNIKS